MFGRHDRLQKHTCQTLLEMFIESAPASTIPNVWIIMGIMIGIFSILPTIDIQAAFGMIMLCVSRHLTVDADIESFATLLIIFWLIRDVHLISQYLLSQLLDDGGIYRRQHPPWSDPAPYLPNGGCYGYSMSHYHCKKKSGHSRPKKGGPAQPITSRSTTYWLARMSFLSALIHVILFCVSGTAMRTNKFSEMHSHVLEDNTTIDDTTTDSGTMFDEKDMTTNWKVTGTTRTFKLWVIPFHWNFSKYLPAYLQWRAHVDSIVHPTCYKDESCGQFDVTGMVPWRLRRLARRRNTQEQIKLERLHAFLDPAMPLPPPEPPPVWNNGWSWEVEPIWYYTILEPAEEEQLEIQFEEVARSTDWKWRQLVSNFVDSHNPSTLMQFVSDVYKPIPTPLKLKVKIDLFDSRPFWKRVLVHFIKLPKAYNGSMKNGLPLIVDTGASVCISPKGKTLSSIKTAKRRSKIYPKLMLCLEKVLFVGKLEIRQVKWSI